MFKSIQKSGRIAAVAIGLLAALSPLAAPPAALASGSVPVPELEKSYSFKVSSDYSYISKGDASKFGYLYDYDYDDDDGYSLKSITLINFDDGSTSPIAIPEKSLDYTTINRDQLYWKDGNNLVVFSPDNQNQTVHPISSAKYAYTGVTVSYDGNRAAVKHYDYESELKKIEIYDLESDKLIQTYQPDKDDSWLYSYSKDMSRLYALQGNTEDGVVALRVFNCDTGSTELKTVNVKKDDRSSYIGYITLSSNSDDIYLESDTALIKADRDGNMSVLFNDDEHAPDWLYSSTSSEFYSVYTKKGSNDLFKEDDGDYYLNEEDANLSVYDLNSDEIIGSIAFPFGDGYLDDISHDGGLLLGTYSDDDKSSACLVDAKTGAKSEFVSHWCSPYFMNGDREIWTDYYDDDSTTLHVNIYKSNIPHSVPEDVLYFVQTHLPFVIGGGVVIVLIIGGAIVVLCIRKKHAKAANGVAASAPKLQRKQRRRQKRAQQNVATPVTPAMPAAPAAPTEPARFCRHCGTPLVPEAQFCPTCGQKVD